LPALIVERKAQEEEDGEVVAGGEEGEGEAWNCIGTLPFLLHVSSCMPTDGAPAVTVHPRAEPELRTTRERSILILIHEQF